MLLLVTIGLVLAGLVLLIVGFVQNSLSYIFFSIACAAVAAVALIVFGRLSRRRALQVALDGGPSAANRTTAEPVARGRAPEPAAPPAWSPPPAAPADTAPLPVVDPAPSAAPEPAAAPPVREAAPVATGVGVGVGQAAPGGDGSQRDDWGDEEAWEDEWGDEVVFPIEDYDELRVAEIIPLLPELEPDELEEVRDREATGKNRSTILQRIEELLEHGAAFVSGPAPFGSEPPAAAYRTTSFPIADYDDLRVSEVLPLLAQLEPGELQVVRARETATKDRGTIVARIDDLLGRTARPPAAAPVARADSAPAATAPRRSAPGERARPRREGSDLLSRYDELRVGEVLPLLASLDADQLRAVREREAAGRSRVTILERITELQREQARTARVPARPSRSASPAKGAATTAPAPRGAPAPAQAPTVKRGAATGRAAAKKAAPASVRQAATARKQAAPPPVKRQGGGAPAKAIPAKATPAKATPAKATPTRRAAKKAE